MATFVFPYNLTAGDTNDPAKVMANLEALRRFVNGDGGSANMDGGNMWAPYIHWTMSVASSFAGLILGGGATNVPWAYRNGPSPFYLKSWSIYLGALAAGDGTIKIQQSADNITWVDVATATAATGFTTADVSYNVPSNHYVRILITAGVGGMTISAPVTIGMRCRSTLSDVA